MSQAVSLQRTFRRIMQYIEGHPVRSVFAVALVVRGAAVAVLTVMADGAVVPDETQYLMLGEAAAHGLLHLLWPEYGLSLYESTLAFSAPLTLAFEIFGSELLVGRLLVAVIGALAAAGATALAQIAMSSRYALIAGGLVALMPSQVLWSSTLLREAFVWLPTICVAIALALTFKVNRASRLALLATLFAGPLWALAHTRQHTFLLAMWTAALSVFLFRPARPLAVRIGVVALTLALPLTAGLGIAGLGFSREAAGRLGTTRTSLAVAADSAIVDNEPEGDVENAFHDLLVSRGVSPKEAERIVASAVEEAERQSDDEARTADQVSAGILTYLEAAGYLDFNLIVGSDGGTIVVDDGLAATMRHLPYGITAVIARPLPWEDTTGLGPRLAQIENLAWYGLYALAAVGAWAWRRRRELIMFPVLLSLAIVAASALTQGNVGTAFRHRGQTLWALAFLAALGLEHLLESRTARSRSGSPVLTAAEAP